MLTRSIIGRCHDSRLEWTVSDLHLSPSEDDFEGFGQDEVFSEPRIPLIPWLATLRAVSLGVFLLLNPPTQLVSQGEKGLPEEHHPFFYFSRLEFLTLHYWKSLGVEVSKRLTKAHKPSTCRQHEYVWLKFQSFVTISKRIVLSFFEPCFIEKIIS